MFYKEADLFDINRVNEISYIKNVDSGKGKGAFLLEHLRRLFTPFYKKSQVKNAEVFFYGHTVNNQRTFDPIIKSLHHSFYNLDNNEDPLISKYLLYSIIGLPSLIKLYYQSDSEHRRIIKDSKFTYLFSYGKLISTRKVLKKVNPKVLVLANDHSPMNRCFLWNATKMGIKTIYTQHASVSNEFPPLAFDYSFLDGEISYDAYGRTSKTGSIVFFSGPCRFDYMQEYLNGEHDYVGVSINEMDDFDVVKSLCLFLKANGCERIKVRPHPSMGMWHYDWFNDNGIVFSTPSKESPGKYLSSLKLQISNVSGIHLDAVILKTPSVLFQLSSAPIADVFQFLERGIVRRASLDNIMDYINNPSDAKPTDEAVRYFISSYQTGIELNVGQFISNMIDCMMDFSFDNKQILERMKLKVGDDIKYFCF